MENMLKDFRVGEHLLLVGNQVRAFGICVAVRLCLIFTTFIQGVGKNKIVDKFLQLLNRPREYIQLHR